MARKTHDPKHGNVFASLAKRSAKVLGSAPPFGVALGVIVIWAATGPVFDFSDTWQLIINTGTTIVTFLMVFLIQNTQNRDSEAIQIKLDELIRSTRGAHNAMIDLEELNQEDLDKIRFCTSSSVSRRGVSIKRCVGREHPKSSRHSESAQLFNLRVCKPHRPEFMRTPAERF